MAESFGDASCDKVNWNIKIFGAFKLHLAVLCALLSSELHICARCRSQQHNLQLAGLGKWQCPGCQTDPSSTGKGLHHSFISSPLPVFHVFPNPFVFIQEEESGNVRHCQIREQSPLVLSVSWCVSLKFFIMKQTAVVFCRFLELTHGSDEDGNFLEKCCERKLPTKSTCITNFLHFEVSSLFLTKKLI